MGDPVTYVLGALTEADCLDAQELRNEEGVRSGLRTPHLSTKGSQEKFYREVICNPASPHRYFAVRRDDASKHCVGIVGLTNISWENGHTEISLVIHASERGQGAGAAAVKLALEEAFDRMRLVTVYAECYDHNPALGFWQKRMAEHGGGCTVIPRRKLWSRRLHDSHFFWFVAGGER